MIFTPAPPRPSAGLRNRRPCVEIARRGALLKLQFFTTVQEFSAAFFDTIRAHREDVTGRPRKPRRRRKLFRRPKLPPAKSEEEKFKMKPLQRFSLRAAASLLA